MDRLSDIRLKYLWEHAAAYTKLLIFDYLYLQLKCANDEMLQINNLNGVIALILAVNYVS